MDINTVISLSSALVAMIALLFTMVQVRETARQTRNLEHTLRTSVYQDMMNGERDLWISFFLEHSDMLKWYLGALGFEIENETENKVKLFHILRFDFQENLYLQYQERILAENVYAGWRRVLEVSFSKKSTQETWTIMGQYYSLPFRTFIDKEIIPKSKILSQDQEH